MDELHGYVVLVQVPAFPDELPEAYGPFESHPATERFKDEYRAAHGPLADLDVVPLLGTEV